MGEKRLGGKVAVVTGGGSGIGQAICTRFAEEGAKVGILEISTEKAVETTRIIEAAGGQSWAFACDVSQQAEVLGGFAHIAENIGSIDIAVNNAGVGHIGTVETTTEADMDRLYAINIKGVYNGCKAAVAQMKSRGGTILNMASSVSLVGIPDRFGYSMSKGAVMTMTYSVACDYLNEKIRCNCIAPARVHTPFVDDYLAKNYPGEEKQMFKQLEKAQPIGRMATPQEIANLAVYLCSDESDFITGTLFPIDGGFMSLRP